MKVLEIHDRFRLLAQQMGMGTVRAVLPEQIDEIINIEILNYVKNIFSRKRNRELNGISDNVVRLSELNPLLVTQSFGNLVKGDVTFGKGYRRTIKSLIPQPMYFATVTSFTGEKSYKCRLIELDKVSDTANDYHSKSITISPICYITADNIEVLATFRIDGLKVSYIKYPTPIDSVTETTTELSDVSMQEVIERAVNTFNAISNNESYEKVSNELQKLE